MLPKSGDLSNPSNWRPIAILKVTYKIFARVLHGRLKHQLYQEQSDEQMGFMPARSTEDALLVLETVISKAIDYHVPLFFASLDLKKAFDRILWPQLFEALDAQGVPRPYLKILSAIYRKQIGRLGADNIFDIKRGVRQGDVLSPLLFNAGLEMVMRRWQTRLRDHGLKLEPGCRSRRLSHVRFADDLIVYANSLGELTEMLDMLNEELQRVGLELNAKKSRIFTLYQHLYDNASEVLVDTAGDFINVVRSSDYHTYFGHRFPGDLKNRGRAMLANRLRCAWAKFNAFRAALTNKHVDFDLRARLFDSIVTPTALYGLSTAPLTANDVEKLASTQRHMSGRLSC